MSLEFQDPILQLMISFLPRASNQLRSGARGKAKIGRPNEIHISSGININVSKELGHALEEYVSDAIEFLKQNRLELQGLQNFGSVENMVLDFDLEMPDSMAHADHFPAELVTLAGQLNICLELSHYAISE